MKVKPKEVLVNLPTVLMFQDSNEIPAMAAAINTILHGKVKVKCEELGNLNGQIAGMLYLQRNDEFQELRNQFMELIEAEEISTADTSPVCSYCSGTKRVYNAADHSSSDCDEC